MNVMKTIFFLITVGFSFFVQAQAAEQDSFTRKNFSVHQASMGHMQQRCFWTAGTVRKIDSENSIVTIFHHAVAELGWPSMTMPFAVKDKALLSRFRVGEQVEFEFLIGEKNSVIVGVR